LINRKIDFAAFISECTRISSVFLLISALYATPLLAQPQPMSARSHALAGAIGSLSSQPDGMFANPAELIGFYRRMVSFSTFRQRYSWTSGISDSPSGSEKIIGGETKSDGYSLTYLQSYFGVAATKGSQKVELSHPLGYEDYLFSDSDFLSVRSAVCDYSSPDMITGVTAVYQKFDYKKPNQSRTTHDFFSVDVGATYFESIYRLSFYIKYAFGQKGRTPRFDDYSRAILLDREPRDMHISFSLGSGTHTAFLIDVGGAYAQSAHIEPLESEPGETETQEWGKWKTKRRVSLAVERLVSSRTVLRFGMTRGKTLRYIDYEQRKLSFDDRTTYYVGANLNTNRIQAEVALGYHRRLGSKGDNPLQSEFYDEIFDTKERLFTVVSTLNFIF